MSAGTWNPHDDSLLECGPLHPLFQAPRPRRAPSAIARRCPIRFPERIAILEHETPRQGDARGRGGIPGKLELRWIDRIVRVRSPVVSRSGLAGRERHYGQFFRRREASRDLQQPLDDSSLVEGDEDRVGFG